MLALLLACTPAEPIQEQPAELPAPWVEHYSAESLIEAGGFSFEEDYLVRRFVDPQASTIREEFIALADGTLTEVYLDISEDGAHFALRFSDESYTGSGTLDGPAWAWTGWQSESVATDGARVISVDTMEEGSIHSEKEGFGPDGASEWTLVEDLSPIDEATWLEGSAAR